eukprot:CAMPEP_0170827278 /NCGR_PEP_ID=MMETSP0733-20121128/47160_1 /TAXON_ID=186038 /ORGANISM="Fragilariopsis kerguelensis, Strain L26-C5" /LENGTH=183 /DNA_ID=CAMNT_0011191399 /DNA_START=135 /DNA_END=682 /DNA_ORIENTATION=+
MKTLVDYLILQSSFNRTLPKIIGGPIKEKIQMMKKKKILSLSVICDLTLPPPQRNTTCDVEIDCTVHEITSVPSDPDDCDTIQWRAVPNLREIWKEERARMKKLLPPELTQEVLRDVFSNDSPNDSEERITKPTTFTLDVKKNAPRSGTKLAVEGMWSLVNVSDGLQENFVRSLTDILERHKD